MWQSIYSISALGRTTLGARENQEDAFAFSDVQDYKSKGFFAVLSDGMGGMQKGEVYSEIAVQEMLDYFYKHSPTEDMNAELLAAYTQARKIAIAQREEKDEADGGATVTAVLLRNDQCSFLSVGDSRIYLLRGEGIIQLNREQVFGTVLDESAALGFLTMEEAKINRVRKMLTNHLNIERDLPCDQSSHPISLLPGDKIALMSDGVFNTLNSKTLTELLLQPNTCGATDIISRIEQLNKPKQDNATVVIICVL